MVTKGLFKKTIAIIFGVVLVTAFFSSFGNQALAQEPGWVFKDKIVEDFLCAEEIYCLNPGAVVNPGSVKLSFGVADPECAPVYEINAFWPDLPEKIKPGDSQSTLLSLNVRQNVPCPAMITEQADISLMFGKSAPEETPNFSFVGEAKIDSFPVNGESKNAESMAAWTAPKGENGERLQVKISAGLKNGLGGYVTYIYEYEDNQNRKGGIASEADNMAQDVCAIGLKKSALGLPSLVKIVSARDSGARFADFSGEVTVAPGIDPENAEPAEIEMVLGDWQYY